jgi:hypothetical protein
LEETFTKHCHRGHTLRSDEAPIEQ